MNHLITGAQDATHLGLRFSDASGCFITFEGVDGSGKTTQVGMLCDHLRSAGYEVVRTREPGGSPGAEEIRGLLLNGSSDRWSDETELLLFTAARRDHLEKLVLPALERGAVVVCDRFADTTRAFQGARGGALAGLVERLHDAVIGVDPGLTILLDIDPDTALERALERSADGVETRMESKGLGLQRRAREVLLELSRRESRICLIEADRDPRAVSMDVVNAVERHLAHAGPGCGMI